MRISLNPAVAIAGHAIFKINSVKHTVAIKRVMVKAWLEHWIGAIAHVGAVQIIGNCTAHHLQLIDLRLECGGSVNAV